MGCEVKQTATKYIREQRNCIVCREAKQSRTVRVDPGIYPRCSFVVEPEECELESNLTLLSDLPSEFKRIKGIVICDSDYSDAAEGDVCELNIVKGPGAMFDPNCICWPEGTTPEQIAAFIAHPDCCMKAVNVFACSEIPEGLTYQTQKSTK